MSWVQLSFTEGIHVCFTFDGCGIHDIVESVLRIPIFRFNLKVLYSGAMKKVQTTIHKQQFCRQFFLLENELNASYSVEY